MVGYSDSTKDGGYLAACWGLQRARASLHRVAAEHGVQVDVLSRPRRLAGTRRRAGGTRHLVAPLRIARRHAAADRAGRSAGRTLRRRADRLSPFGASDLGHAGRSDRSPARRRSRQWIELIERLVASGRWRSIASWSISPASCSFSPRRRRSKRSRICRSARGRPAAAASASLGDLRAIPWVFSWTQNRCIIPAWYGLGTAPGRSRKIAIRPAGRRSAKCISTGRSFRAAIDNAALAWPRPTCTWPSAYAGLVESSRGPHSASGSASPPNSRGPGRRFWTLVGEPELLAATPWFQRSIEARNPYIDPLNLIQIEFMQRAAMPPPKSIRPSSSDCAICCG